jgi:hypothetical protein
MDLKEIEWESVDWIYLAQNGGMWRYVVSYGEGCSFPIKCGEFLD